MDAESDTRVPAAGSWRRNDARGVGGQTPEDAAASRMSGGCGLSRRLTPPILALLILFIGLVPPLRAEPVDLELVLATDVSRSIDVMEARLQREGIAAAIRNPAVIEAIQGGYRKKIAVAYIDYSNHGATLLVIDWTVIDGPAAAEAFAAQLTSAELNFGRRTSISDGIAFAVRLLEENRYEGLRRVIDVAGDGPNNDGLLVTQARDAALKKRITINGLPIINQRGGFGSQFNLGDLDDYYRGCVIGGPNAFLVVARDFPDFARAIRRKLIFEIAGHAPPANGGNSHALFYRAQIRLNQGYVYERGCDIGERLWRQRWGGSIFDTN